jgi:hypothetical protein
VQRLGASARDVLTVAEIAFCFANVRMLTLTLVSYLLVMSCPA